MMEEINPSLDHEEADFVGRDYRNNQPIFCERGKLSHREWRVLDQFLDEEKCLVKAYPGFAHRNKLMTAYFNLN